MAELIVALDFGDAGQALDFARRLPKGIWFKVGLELFIAAGPAVVQRLKELGSRVFLDLKIYDIPNTAARAALACARLEADMLTFHCQGGLGMCKAVSEALAPLPEKPLTLGVTVLTSFGPGQMPLIRSGPREAALELAGIAKEAGFFGLVCSGAEAAELKRRYPGLACVCPGIRPKGSARNDQARTMTPAEAVCAGADYLVIGRPITAAPDPCARYEEILAEMNSNLK